MPGELLKPALWAFDSSVVDPFWQEFFWKDCIACIPCWEGGPAAIQTPGAGGSNSIIQPQVLSGKRGDIVPVMSCTISSGTLGWIPNKYGWAVNFNSVNVADLNIPAVSSVDIVPNNRVTMLVVSRRTTTSNATRLPVGMNVGGAGACAALMPWTDSNIYWDFGGTAGANRLTWSGHTATTTEEVWAFVAGTKGSAIYLGGIQKASQATAITRTAGNNTFSMTSGDAQGGPTASEISFLAVLDAEWTPGMVAAWAEDPFAPVRFADQGGVTIPSPKGGAIYTWQWL